MDSLIRLCFSDFWALFDYDDNFFLRILKKRFNIIIDNENPDYVIYSTYGTNFLRYTNAIKILYISENVRPSYMECDYSISFDYANYNNRNLRFPLYVMYGFIPELLEKKRPELILADKPKFCNMVVSNSASKNRIDFFHLLNKYKKIDSGGRVLNNVGGPVFDKIDFIKNYRFTIAFENSSYPGYTTEKIFEAMKVNSIPIYWGNKEIKFDFNEKSFVNVHSFNSLKCAAEHVMELEDNIDKLQKMLSEPWFKNNLPSEYFDFNRFCDFFEEHIFSRKPAFTTQQIIFRTSLAKANVFRKKFISKLFHKSYCHIS